MSVLFVIRCESHVGDVVFDLNLFLSISPISSWSQETKSVRNMRDSWVYPFFFRWILCPFQSLGFFFSNGDTFMLMTHSFLYFYINRFCLPEPMNYVPCLNFPKGLWFSLPFSLQLIGWLSLRHYSKALSLIIKYIYVWYTDTHTQSCH